VATIKSMQQFFDPDPASLSLGPPLEKQYDMLEYFRLHGGVPDSVRSYMASVVTLWLYGWLYYPFYALVSFLSTTAVEMALRERLPRKLDRKGRDRRGLSDLLQTAKTAGLLSGSGLHQPQVPAREYGYAGAGNGKCCQTDSRIPGRRALRRCVSQASAKDQEQVRTSASAHDNDARHGR
jgi:hypothetical protein